MKIPFSLLLSSTITNYECENKISIKHTFTLPIKISCLEGMLSMNEERKTEKIIFDVK